MRILCKSIQAQLVMRAQKKRRGEGNVCARARGVITATIKILHKC